MNDEPQNVIPFWNIYRQRKYILIYDAVRIEKYPLEESFLKLNFWMLISSKNKIYSRWNSKNDTSCKSIRIMIRLKTATFQNISFSDTCKLLHMLKSFQTFFRWRCYRQNSFYFICLEVDCDRRRWKIIRDVTDWIE